MANQASAASSSSVPSCSCSTSYTLYDVFINHRGPDVKDTFAAHLYSRLRARGLQVFLDKPELKEGHQITPQIQSAIKVASVHIAIFSPRYAESKWCLDELVLMVESTATILPVFYKVKPSDLRWTMKDGVYARALRNLEEKKTLHSKTGEEKPRYDSDTILNWKKALSYAAEISGFELQGDEEELLRKVVQGVLKNVPKLPLDVAKYPTGLDEKFQEFEKTIWNEHEARMGAKVVGIVGHGGVGKTTLAKEIFNRNRSLYSESSFLFDVRETAAQKSLCCLQSKLLEHLKHTKDINIDSHDEGMEILKRHLSSCHALIIIEDVDNINQLDALLPMKNTLDPNSLILVTTRDKHILRSSGVPETSLYNLKGLNRLHSKELFCFHAFNQLPHPPEFELIDQFVTECDGLPLSLRVIGALVCGEDELYWEEQLERLRQTLPEEIHERLRISYNSLSKEDKPIFLDIACVFLGKNRDRAIRIWGLVGVRNLENKCLLEVDSENKVRMHDHIRDCARSIAEEESMPRRIGQLAPNIIYDLLEKSSSVETEVRGITSEVYPSFFDVVKPREHGQSEIYLDIGRMISYDSSEMGRKFNDFDVSGMKNLRLLAAEDTFLEGILSRVQPPQLTWLQWYGCSRSSLPDWIPMQNLRVLEVAGSSLESLWARQCQAPAELRELNIIAPLSEFPESIGQLKHLEWITIAYDDRYARSSSFCGVTTLPEEFCNLSSLKYLALIGLSRLMSLPESFGKLTKLQHIDLEGARSLKILPDSFGDLTRLKYLSLSGCSILTITNGTLGNITSLEYLDLGNCSNVKELPPQVAHQRYLKELYLRYTDIKELPSDIGDLCNLEVLEIGNNSLEILPPSLGSLKSLKVFYVGWLPKLNRLPDSLAMLTGLKEFWLFDSGIEYLPQDLPKFNSLERLEVYECPLLEFQLLLKGGTAWSKLDSTSDNCMFGLKRLHLSGTKISELAFPEGVCPNLECLEIGNCQELWQIGGLCSLAKLNYLTLLYCVKVEELPSLEALRSLEVVRVEGCSKLKSIAGIGQLTKLRDLTVGGCDEIAGLPSVEHCTSLAFLSVCRCSKLKSIPGMGQLAKLKRLDVSGCDEIVRLAGVEDCRSLVSLYASKCPKLKSITGLGHLTKLEWLDVSGCDEIAGLAGVEDCRSLVSLYASKCPKLKNITGLWQLTKLERLDVSGCHEIEMLAGVEHCSRLSSAAEETIRGNARDRCNTLQEKNKKWFRVVKAFLTAIINKDVNTHFIVTEVR